MNVQRRNRKGNEKCSHKDIGKEHNPLELGPSKSGLFATTSEPSALDTVVVLVVGTGHTGFVSLERLTTTALLAHP